MTELEKYCKGLADINRLRILNLLIRGELCGCDIQYVLESSQPNVSRHLQYLKNSGLVLDRRDGYRVYYRLAEPRLGLRKPLFEFLQLAFKGDEPFRSDAKRLKEAINQGACTLSEMSSSTALVSPKSADSARA
ncbi:MAG TPA: metalloregulator ArsR/SmtB family transcription factor [Terracidiphilus sp.]|nr:metalloregulator ArsR/SmtB family transcription factor [Terracidiphilus sp.]HEV2397995.1 metalloregulator ArsR/SmtB family transcription factor [Candidatus Sulfotelmatobacter sp.]